MQDNVLKKKYTKTDITISYGYNDKSRKRLLAYYNLINKLNEKTEAAEFVQDKWKTVQEVREKSSLLMPDFVIEGDIVVECMHRNIILETYITIIKREKPEEEELAVTLWQKVVHILEKEREWEKSTMQFLNELAATHPLISKALVAVLSGVLIGLLTNCISEGITLKKTEVADQVGQKIVAEVVIESARNILIEKYDGKEFYEILYFTEEGIFRKGYIHKDSVAILYESSQNYLDDSKRPE